MFDVNQNGKFKLLKQYFMGTDNSSGIGTISYDEF